MNTVYSAEHQLHHGKHELIDGRLEPCVEKPERAERILKEIRHAKLGEVIAPQDFGLEPLTRVHNQAYLGFLQTAYRDWQAAHKLGDALPYVWPTSTSRHTEPRAIEAKLGRYAFDAGTPITPGSWQAACSSANVALTGAQRVTQGAHAAFALCRPPGHHASRAHYGGYCFLNNASIAAQALLDQGASSVAILDVDYHHGNGTQAIFYHRPEVLFVSIHADPAQEYPYFSGYSDETGEGAGEGATLNLPLPQGTLWDDYAEALEVGLERIHVFAPGALIVSLGVDTFKHDPIARFRLESTNFTTLGAHIATLKLPTLFVMEGGYAVEALGGNVVNVLRGFLER